MAQLALQTPMPELLKRPPIGPMRLGSDVTGYGTDNLACHYLGVHYKVAFVTEKSSVKDTLRIAMENTVAHKKPMPIYSDVRDRSIKDIPLLRCLRHRTSLCHVFIPREKEGDLSFPESTLV